MALFAFSTTLKHGIHELANRPTNTVPGLDALRSAAIILVISGHYYATFAHLSGQELGIGRFPLFFFGWTGVDLFFVLSGYLIGRQLWRELRDTSALNVSRFVLRRGLRIWPYYFAFIIWFVLFVTKRHWTEFWPDVFFVSNYTQGRISGGWSLSTEEQFYLTVPILLLLFRRVLSFNRQWIWIACILVLLPIVRSIVLARYGAHAHEGMSMFVTTTPIYTHSDGLVVGLLIAWLSIAHAHTLNPRSVPRNLIVPVLLAFAGAVLRQLNQDLFAFTGLAFVYGGAVLFVLRDRSVVSTFCSSHAFYVMSRLSFGMYLNHFVVLDSVMPRIIELMPETSAPYLRFATGYVCAFLISVVGAAITFVLIESPFLQFRDQWLRYRKAPVSVEAVA